MNTIKSDRDALKIDIKKPKHPRPLRNRGESRRMQSGTDVELSILSIPEVKDAKPIYAVLRDDRGNPK